jgi:hypothetical protein
MRSARGACSSFASDALAADEPSPLASLDQLKIAWRLTACVETCADYYSAAATYEQLSALTPYGGFCVRGDRRRGPSPREPNYPEGKVEHVRGSGWRRRL